MFRPRPAQARVLAWRGGKMGVSAVPGSGKTATLVALAARLVREGGLAPDQEVLVVTLVNSAVNNFAARLAQELQDSSDFLPGMVGFRVRTLHGLANDVVKERPGLAGLAEDFRVIDEREASDILQEAVDGWLRGNPEAARDWLGESFQQNRRVLQQNWPALLRDVAGRYIRQAKDEELDADQLRELMPGRRMSLSLADTCQAIFESYESGLRYRGGVDFSDLIRLALRVLKNDADYLARLQGRWPWILEDEAQDSSLLQERILRLLAGTRGNWSRVGDPNQAINESFTTANPNFLRHFLEEPDVASYDMPESGRSAAAIFDLANGLIDWSLQHPQPEVRERRPLEPPYIEPAPPGDAQANPVDVVGYPHLHHEALTADEERALVLRSLGHWLPQNPDATVAVLLPTNSSGSKLVEQLRAAGLPYRENLSSTDGTRAVAGSLYRTLEYLANPHHSAHLSQVYRVWRRDERNREDARRSIRRLTGELRRLRRTEDYLWPAPGEDWLDEFCRSDAALRQHLDDLRRVLRRWQEAADLPIDQLLLTIGGDLFRSEAEIAMVWSLAVHLRQFAELYADARLPEFTSELRQIAAGRRRFLAVGDEDSGFDPEQYRGKVVVTTLHKAKGLEWDRVYLMSANTYDFPSAMGGDQYFAERWFVRDNLNLEAEALAQLEALTRSAAYREGAGTRAARTLLAAERLRLLYVGITRARRELVITWNTGRNGDLGEALPVRALREAMAAERAS